ncbi:hypothetical protein [Clostridium baratii]|uniref:hypothetical protein n=1 Tax=Clostridium baratii TaxID=1561 RepID=UPI0030D2DB36
MQKCRICGCSDLSKYEEYCCWEAHELCSKCFWTLSDEERELEIRYRYRKYRIADGFDNEFPIYSPEHNLIAICSNIEDARKIVRLLNSNLPDMLSLKIQMRK